jgi:hypothetical protein
MMEIYTLPRMTSFEIHRIMDIFDNEYTHLDELEPDKYWVLQDKEEIWPQPTFDLPNSVIESAKLSTRPTNQRWKTVSW